MLVWVLLHPSSVAITSNLPRWAFDARLGVSPSLVHLHHLKFTQTSAWRSSGCFSITGPSPSPHLGSSPSSSVAITSNSPRRAFDVRLGVSLSLVHLRHLKFTQTSTWRSSGCFSIPGPSPSPQIYPDERSMLVWVLLHPSSVAITSNSPRRVFDARLGASPSLVHLRHLKFAQTSVWCSSGFFSIPRPSPSPQICPDECSMLVWVFLHPSFISVTSNSPRRALDARLGASPSLVHLRHLKFTQTSFRCSSGFFSIPRPSPSPQIHPDERQTLVWVLLHPWSISVTSNLPRRVFDARLGASPSLVHLHP